MLLCAVNCCWNSLSAVGGSHSLVLYRHARHRTLQTKAPDDSPLSSPKAVFLQLPDQCFLARRLPPSARNRPLVTAFCSPATAAASRLPPFQGQSSQPATSLPCQIGPVPGPPFGSTAANPVAPVAAASLPGARCSSTTRCACRSCCLHSPLGFLHPSGSKRSTALAACRSTWRIHPIPSRSPLPALESWGCGSSFQGRYVSAGLLFLTPHVGH
jgi:hypothetical protein